MNGYVGARALLAQAGDFRGRAKVEADVTAAEWELAQCHITASPTMGEAERASRRRKAVLALAQASSKVRAQLDA